MEQPRTNIEVRMTIPSQTYMAAAQEITEQYNNVILDALNETKESLMFDKKFQEEVKNEIKNQIRESVETAIKSAARNVVWDLYGGKEKEIKKMIENAILETRKS